MVKKYQFVPATLDVFFLWLFMVKEEFGLCINFISLQNIYISLDIQVAQPYLTTFKSFLQYSKIQSNYTKGRHICFCNQSVVTPKCLLKSVLHCLIAIHQGIKVQIKCFYDEEGEEEEEEMSVMCRTNSQFHLCKCPFIQ